MLPLDACAGRNDVGGKAATLARMRAAGLAVPEGVVLLHDERVDAATLTAALAQLGGASATARFAVRSSASLEDAAGGSAAGLFTSVIGVPAAEVARAIAEVRASLTAPALTAYREARSLSSAARMAVIIQPVVAAERYGVAHSRDVEFAVEERAPGEPEWGNVRGRRVARGDAGALATGLRALEQLVGGPVDAEFARTGDSVTWLQARPLVAALAHGAAPAFTEPGRWRFDAEHNPDPLSAAQASLVARVEALGIGARQRVIGGYLYVEEGGRPRALRPIALPDLRQRFDADVVPDCTAVLAAAEASGDLDAAVAAFCHVYQRYVGEVAPSLSRARQQLDQFLRMNLAEPLTAHGALLGGLGGATLARDQALWDLSHSRATATLSDYAHRFGDHAPAWDVATPTDRERPDRVVALVDEIGRSPESPMQRHERALAVADATAEALLDRLDRMARHAFKALLPAVRQALPIAEDDDLLFLRAQATVRRALLRRARQLGLEHLDDVFELSIDEALSDEPAQRLRAGVVTQRAERLAAARRVPPCAYDDGQPEWPAPRARLVLRGAATAGQARGRAVIVRALADAPQALADDAILVVPAIVPSLTPLLSRARALVTDHGGALSHGATLAREYGVPAVLGVGGATALPDGVDLWVDGDSGRVYVLGD
ncbi:MAG: PEP-utilizing protein mobile region [Myxococcales bacterium]|nr:PEP-utilizing protein mobile region [Myxococcales bacterium]